MQQILIDINFNYNSYYYWVIHSIVDNGSCVPMGHEPWGEWGDGGSSECHITPTVRLSVPLWAGKAPSFEAKKKPSSVPRRSLFPASAGEPCTGWRPNRWPLRLPGGATSPSSASLLAGSPPPPPLRKTLYPSSPLLPF